VVVVAGFFVQALDLEQLDKQVDLAGAELELPLLLQMLMV
jgi:hypothetical protein